MSLIEQKWSLDLGGETKLLGIMETESSYKTAKDNEHSEVNWWIFPTGLIVSVRVCTWSLRRRLDIHC